MSGRRSAEENDDFHQPVALDSPWPRSTLSEAEAKELQQLVQNIRRTGLARGWFAGVCSSDFKGQGAALQQTRDLVDRIERGVTRYPLELSGLDAALTWARKGRALPERLLKSLRATEHRVSASMSGRLATELRAFAIEVHDWFSDILEANAIRTESPRGRNDYVHAALKSRSGRSPKTVQRRFLARR